MKSTVEQLNPTRVKVTVEVPFEELKPSLDAAYRAIAKQINVPGFRRGKVPPAVIDRQVGRGAVLGGKVKLDHLPLPDAVHARKAQRAQRMADRLALRIEDAVLQHDGDASFHRTGLQLISVGLTGVAAGMTPRRRATSV